MTPTTSPKSAHVMTRLICALLATLSIAAIVLEIVTSLHTGQVPPVGDLVGVVMALGGASFFGLYAIEGGGGYETGVLSEPSERVKNLALRPGSKVEAIKAYREQTGVDAKRAIEVVERVAALGRPQA